MIQESINKVLEQLAIFSILDSATKSSEMSKKAEESLKEHAKSKIEQNTTFEEYKKTIYKSKED